MSKDTLAELIQIDAHETKQTTPRRPSRQDVANSLLNKKSYQYVPTYLGHHLPVPLYPHQPTNNSQRITPSPSPTPPSQPPPTTPPPSPPTPKSHYPTSQTCPHTPPPKSPVSKIQTSPATAPAPPPASAVPHTPTSPRSPYPPPAPSTPRPARDVLDIDRAVLGLGGLPQHPDHGLGDGGQRRRAEDARATVVELCAPLREVQDEVCREPPVEEDVVDHERVGHRLCLNLPIPTPIPFPFACTRCCCCCRCCCFGIDLSPPHRLDKVLLHSHLLRINRQFPRPGVKRIAAELAGHKPSYSRRDGRIDQVPLQRDRFRGHGADEGVLAVECGD
ncbi:hypothetical protein M8818_002959 [Zalaria obscura]|uniref:Uncharacterized protein n=1 Tax=Zalaria obscura TaxID=2024903 RepID=A0ACC3SFI5_9PEZI